MIDCTKEGRVCRKRMVQENCLKFDIEQQKSRSENDNQMKMLDRKLYEQVDTNTSEDASKGNQPGLCAVPMSTMQYSMVCPRKW